MSNRGSLVKILLTLLVLGTFVASDAMAARKARATGFWRANVGQINLPVQFVLSIMPGGHDLHLGFPNDDAMIDGDISLLGMAPAAIHFPMSLIDGNYAAGLPLMGTANVQLTSMFGVKAPFTSGGVTFEAGGGPGALSHCAPNIPGFPGGVGAACPTTAGGMASTGWMNGGAGDLAAPPQGTGTNNGRLVFMGGSGFGGVGQVFLVGTGQLTGAAPAPHGFGSAPFWAQQMSLAGSALRPTGGPSTAVARAGNAQTYTQPKTAPLTISSIPSSKWGPHVTTMGGLTSCPTTGMGAGYPNILTATCNAGGGGILTVAPGGSTITGFPFTTGTVLAQNSTNTAPNGVGDFVTITGSDARTANGIGNIAMVTGGLRRSLSGTAGPNFAEIVITISEKTPSMTPGGMAAAAMLMVVAAGYALRRRL